MQINATFIVQIINFALTYVLLSRFLLYPFMALIHQKQASRHTLSAILENKILEEQLLIQSKENDLIAFRTYVHQAYQRPSPASAYYPNFQEQKIDNAYVQAMIQKATAIVVEKVPHV